ncbi:hypothetical protein ACOMHN_023317 [Nucella lapillus]
MQITVLWKEGQQREPHATGYESENTFLTQRDSPGENVPGNQTDVVVLDKVLEYVDDQALMNSRLVSRRWEREITGRSALWRRRCERLGVRGPGETFPPKTDFFRVYVNLKRILRQMSCGEGWQGEENCDGSRCPFHREMARCSERDSWVYSLVPGLVYMDHFKNKIVVRTRYGELVVLDEENKEVAWRTDKNAISTFRKYKDQIVAVTLSGIIELYSLDGKCAVRKTSLKLLDVKSVFAHPTAPILLVWLRNNKVFIVNDDMQVFPLHLPAPQLSDQQRSQEPTDAEHIESLYFDMNVDHSDGQMAVAIVKRSRICFVIFTKRGVVLHHLFVKCKMLSEWSAPLAPGQGSQGIKLCFTRHAGIRRTSLGQLVRKVQHVEDCLNMVVDAGVRQRISQSMYLVNSDWLHGLSPSTMTLDFPVAVLFSKENQRGKCLRWCEGLWGDIALPPTQEGGQASDPIAH